jgi:hypothetical protein
MPALAAASARLMPPSALAIANRRRAIRASVSALASFRSTAGVRSLRIFSFCIADPVSRIICDDGITILRPRESLDGNTSQPLRSTV